jgi:cell wall assembly regulator SMI1
MQHPVSESWDRIVSWLRSNAPSELENLGLPATLDELEAAAVQLGVPLPGDFSDFYQIVNGTHPEGASSAILPAGDEWDMAFSPLSLAQVVDAWAMQKELLEMGDFSGLDAEASEGVAADWWNVGWIPFAGNGGGDYYCVDTAPADGGTAGQVISHSHESGERRKLADSLAQYLDELAESLEAGLFIHAPEYGVRKRTAETERQAAQHQVRQREEAYQEAEIAFRNKEYETVVVLLEPFKAGLDKVWAAKLAIALKRRQPS